MYSILTKLISAKFYSSAEAASQKADVFYACNKLADAEYAEITALIAQMYPAPEPQREAPPGLPPGS